jgi:hypothetical protein
MSSAFSTSIFFHTIQKLKEAAMKTIFIMLFTCVLMTACASKVGSDAWCAKLKDTSKADWSLNDTKNYAKHCVFK